MNQGMKLKNELIIQNTTDLRITQADSEFKLKFKHYLQFWVVT